MSRPHQQPPRGWDASGTLTALRELLTAGARVNHVVARRAGISDTELVTLEHLSREQIGPAEVARRLEVSTAAATGIVDRLVARGHVERRPHAADRRRTELVLTEELRITRRERTEQARVPVRLRSERAECVASRTREP